MRFRAIEKNKNRFLTIMYDVNFGKDRLRGKTDLFVDRNCITSFNPLEIKKTKDFSQTEKLNLLNKLNDFEIFVEKAKAKLKSSNLKTKTSSLKEDIEVYFGRTKEQEKDKVLSFFEFIEYYTDFKEKDKFEKNGIIKTVGTSTLYEYRRVFQLLKDYRERTKTTLNYKDINRDFISSFQEYLEDLNLKTNTIGKHIKNIKMFMNKAHIEGYHNNLKYKNFKVLRETVKVEYLNEKELEELYNRRSGFSEDERPKIDYFLLMAYTSLRVSDMLKLRRKNIIQDEISLIEYFESKNSVPRYIKITDNVQRILDDYEGGFPNDVIKRKVNIAESINRELRRAIKNKKITCHCGRRSYVNNEIIKGTSYEDIMRNTGHKTMTAFNSYVSQSTDRELLKAKARREFQEN
jgi:integrase